MSNENIVLARNTERAPKHPLAAQTVAFSHYNHLSAQLPIEPTSGQLVEGGIRAQATQCLKNIQAVVESINHVMSDIVRMTIFVKDMRDVAAVEEVYAAPTTWSTILPSISLGVNGWPFSKTVTIPKTIKIINKILKDESCFLFFFFFSAISFYTGTYFPVSPFSMINYSIDQ